MENKLVSDVMEEIKNKKTIKIKYHNPNLPKLEYIDGKSDWIDLRASRDCWFEKGQWGLIPLGISMKLPDGYEAHIAPRSSTFKHWGLLQVNSVGVIDESYCGDSDEWCMRVYATKDVHINEGDRVCLFRIMEHQPKIVFSEVKSLGEESRGGFGSTGKN